ncbi:MULTISPECIES: hypothetical protein [unclassified Xanthobacter]|uniref:hypothetical protein n=1 Tax=unclassified Xanthobacter TaxID=2623496 RepID=UPI001F252195|nr:MULTISPECIES: hypothetical protein [unclassified Xanthobacter]
MFPHVSATGQHQLLVRHRRLIHAPSEAIIRAWCNPALFIKLHAAEPDMGVEFSLNPTDKHHASVALGRPHDDIQERLPLCMSYQPSGPSDERHVAGPTDDPYAMRLGLTLSPTLHLAAGTHAASATSRTSCTLSLSVAEGEVYENWAWPLLNDALQLLTDALGREATTVCV